MTPLETARTVVELMVLTAWADGKVEGSEALAVHRTVSGDPFLQQVGSTAELSKKARQDLATLGLEDALRTVAARLTERAHRELAFASCVKVMGADGNFEGEEALVLGTLQESFGFDTADVKRLMVLATR